MKFLPLLHVQLKHSFYRDGMCPDFRIEPSAETQTLLRNHRCTLKTFSTGFRIFITAADQNEPLIPLDIGARFKFFLHLENAEFPLFTNLSFMGINSMTVFTNGNMQGDGPHELAPQALPSAGSRKHFSSLEIEYNDSWIELGDTAEEFQISFDAKELKWTYYLLTDDASALFEIEDKSTEPILFSGTKQATNGADADDTMPIVQSLVEKYPELVRWDFISAERVACRQQPRKSLQLNLSDDKVLSPLPNPPVRNHAQIENDAQQKEDMLYQVIKYVSNQFQTAGG